MTEWQSTEPNPDEEYLQALWKAEIRSFERSIVEEGKASRRRQANTLPLLKGGGLSQGGVAKLLKEDADLSRRSLKEVEQQLVKPPIDFETFHKQDLELAQANAERIEGHNPSWQGFIWAPGYGGAWWEWNGEAEEVPGVTFNVGASRVDPRVQAWGEGWWDADFSRMHAYLAFRFRPPSWGHLHIHTYPWLHGYYSLYSNDAWYKGEYARAEVDTWVDAHQNFWRARQYRRRFTLGGDELHPERSDRIDGQYGHHYFTNVGANDTTTVRVGVRLYSRAKASGGRSKLNFQAGGANYVYVPYVFWYLHH
jgi:hypothetical protein